MVLFWFHENLRVYLVRVLVYTAVRVRGRGPSGCSRRYVRMRGLLHSDEPDKWMGDELWVGVTLSGWSPVTWAPMK